MNLDLQIAEYPEWRENKYKCSNPGVEEIDKPRDMSNKQHVSIYIKTITRETDRPRTKDIQQKHTVQI